MKIETKFNIGEKVYFMYQNKIERAKITRMKIEVYEILDNPIILYSIILNYKILDVYEHEIFKNKQELIATL